jgi:diaminopimelate decarboxylase
MIDLPFALAHDIARRVDTPCYIYDETRIRSNYARLALAFGADGSVGAPKICYALKANGNFEILRLLHRLGAGFDVVSAGEMQRALHIGATPANIVFAGVGKRDDELVAALQAHIGWINVESEQELRVLSDLALAHGLCQRTALRINPGVDAHTHSYLSTGVANSKFGIDVTAALRLIAERAQFPGVSIEGIHFHIGSMVNEAEPYEVALNIALDIVQAARALGCAITMLDIGGGFGIAYTPDQQPANIQAIGERVVAMARAADLHLHLEPGRYIIGDAGALLTRVLYTKCNGGVHYAVVDAAMNDLIRPALYGASHRVSGFGPPTPDPRHLKPETQHYEIVGPVCESGDFLAHAVALPHLQRGDLLLVHDAGAYGMAMASNYNTRPRAAEVLLNSRPPLGAGGEGEAYRLIRPRENLQVMFAAEAV